MKYNAFISYSHHKDSGLAQNLEKALEKFAKPTFKRRALNIFRDANDLSASPDLWGKIEEGLNQSDYFILLASPSAAQSHWCIKEVAFWKQHKPMENFLIAITDGELVWDEINGDFDWTKTTAIPKNLSLSFNNEPLYVDFRNNPTNDKLTLNNSDFRRKIVLLSATLHGKKVGDMDGEGVKQHNRTIRIRNSAIIVLALLLVAAGLLSYFALQQKGVAEQQTELAKENEDKAKQQTLEAEKARAASEYQLLLTRLQSYLVQSKSNEEIDPLLAFRVAEKGYNLSKENNIDSKEFENQLIKIVYSKRPFQLNIHDKYIIDTTYNTGIALSHTLKAVGKKNNESNDLGNSIIEFDESLNQVYEYTNERWNTGWHDPFFSNDGNFVVARVPPEGGEVSGSGFILFRHMGDKISEVYARLYTQQFRDCPFFFGQSTDGLIIFDDYNSIIGYPFYNGTLKTDSKFQLEGFGEKTSAMSLSPSGRKFASASEDGKVKFYNTLNLIEPEKTSKSIEFVAHKDKIIKEIAFCNNETILKTVTETETKFWPILSKSVNFNINYSEVFKFKEPFTGEEMEFKIDRSKWGRDSVGSFRLNNKSLSTNLGETLIWLDLPNHDNDPFIGGLTDDGRYMYANYVVYPLDAELILKLVNEYEALGKLLEIDVE